MRYLVVVEHGPTSVGAYVPDLPGCVAVGESESETLELIREAIELHLEALQEQGLNPPAPSSSSTFIDVAAV
jgi:predicted RNase H-like HicB family nuclease